MNIRDLIVDEKTYIIWIQNGSIIDILVIRDSNLIKWYHSRQANLTLIKLFMNFLKILTTW